MEAWFFKNFNKRLKVKSIDIKKVFKYFCEEAHFLSFLMLKGSNAENQIARRSMARFGHTRTEGFVNNFNEDKKLKGR